MKKIRFQRFKHRYLIHTSLNKAGTVVNRALPSLNGESLEIMLTVPLNPSNAYDRKLSITSAVQYLFL